MIEYAFLVLQIGFFIYLLYFIIAFLLGAPFVPSNTKTAEAMIAAAGIKPGMRVYDMGSGDGRLLLAAAARGARATGYELNPILALGSIIRSWFSKNRRNIHVYCKNFWSADVSDADVVFVYLLPWHMERLAKKLQKETKKGTLVVSHSFLFPDWKPIRKDTKNHVYAFRVN
jgi:16S rRNA A1518/A1519 N6-dimethyltransferase RsmA/KsgA/DIM1 with predicted DNA glycosylase/AP lyase activity